MVGTGFDLELSLSLSCGSGRDGCLELEKANNSPRIDRSRYESVFGNIAPCQPQQITIFYNGRIRVFDVTENQARDIISMAKQEMENSTAKINVDHQQQQCPTDYECVTSSSTSPSQSSPHKAVVQKLFSPELSMKRSLQRFLQKRKSRSDAVSPYNYTRQLLLSAGLKSSQA